MRCRVGDLAVVVGGVDLFLGHVVTIASPCAVYPEHWVVEPPKFYPGFTQPVSFADATLMPIRPGGSADEVAADAGKPEEVTA